MFERFTDRARRVVVLAQEEARLLNHNRIGTEHILLGLIHEGDGVAAHALKALDISLGAVRREVEQIIGRGKDLPSGHIPFTPRAKKVLELSLRESLQLGHNYIGTEHILLGLIREGEGVAAQVLVKLGTDLNRVRQQVIQLLHGKQGTGTPEPGDLRIEIRTIESRLSAVEQRVGTGPDVTDIDLQVTQTRRDKETAIGAQNFERASVLRDRENELITEIASRRRTWAASHQDLPAVAERLDQLSKEIERLRGLIGEQAGRAERAEGEGERAEGEQGTGPEEAAR